MSDRIERYCRAVLQGTLDNYYRENEKKCQDVQNVNKKRSSQLLMEGKRLNSAFITTEQKNNKQFKKTKELQCDMKAIVIKLKNVFVYSMEGQIPVSLFYDGNIYRLDKAGVCETKKTEELNNLVKERRKQRDDERGENLGPLLARTSNGTLIHENPLNEIVNLKKEGKMTTLSVSSVLRKYYKNRAPTTIVNYRTGYKNFVNKAKRDDIRLNTVPGSYETVTEKDRAAVEKAVLELGESSFDTILKHLDMTEYKLRLILSEDRVYKTKGDKGKEIYSLKDPTVVK